MKLNISKLRFRTIGAGLVVALLAGLSPEGILIAGAAPGDYTRVSVDSSEAQANNRSFGPALMNSDGRYVVFLSEADNLVAGDTAGATDVFVRDTQAGTTERASVDSAGVQANDESDVPDISSDGRFVVFASVATNLASGDTNGVSDIFVHDRQTGQTTRVSVDSASLEANGESTVAAISGDGRYVAFSSAASNLVSGDTNGVSDIFVHDRQTGVTERVSVAGDGSQGNGTSTWPSISNDGNRIEFSSRASNLVGDDTNGANDIFVRERGAATTIRASVATDGHEGSQGASQGEIAGNGRYVAFSTASDNLITGQETFANVVLYVHDLQTGATDIQSTFSDGYEMVGWNEEARISDDGRYLVFEFDDKGDGMPIRVIYAHDRLTGMSLNISGSSSSLPAVSGNGLIFTVASGAADFVTGDTNGVADVFARQLTFGPDPSPVAQEIASTCFPPSCAYPTPALVSFRVTFSEIVTGVTADDFILTTTGNVTGASIASARVSTNSGLGNIYIVDVNTGSGDGTLRLDLADNDSIQDIGLNPLGGSGPGNGNFNTGEVLIVDKSTPSVAGITRADPDPNSGDTVHFTVNFSEPVTGVDAADFILTPTDGVTGATISEVTGSGNSYSVTANTGAGNGTLRLDLVDDDSIIDSVNSPLGGAGAGNGSFTTGEAYTFVRDAPSVVSILRTDTNPTNADTVHFTVNFSEPVSGVDPADFLLAASGLTGAAITGVSGADAAYTVTTSTGSGHGTLRLDLIDNDSILDASSLSLGGTGAANGNFTTGEAYTVDKAQGRFRSEDLRSNGANDGWVLESQEDSNTGGSVNAKAATFPLGDDTQDRQFRAILHFPTSHLPDNVVITQAILMIKGQGVLGTDPFTTHQNIVVDINSGYFGSAGFFGINSLDPTDFQAPSRMDAAGFINNNPVGGWYWSLLNPASYQFINLQGVTQFRLRFQVDDNDDLASDYIAFISGNHPQVGERPHLLIEYFMPR